jgi:YesN/AraC family two-component response regulator
MPEMDGITCARSILEDDPGAKIVLISGYEATGPTGIDDTTKSFIKGYLSKPIDVVDLTSLLERVIKA